MVPETLFHLSPVERRASILQQGLVPKSPSSINARSSDGISACADLPTALAMSRLTEDDLLVWDVWEISLSYGAEVHVLPYLHPGPVEYRLKTVVPPSHLNLQGVSAWQAAKQPSSTSEPIPTTVDTSDGTDSSPSKSSTSGLPAKSVA